MKPTKDRAKLAWRGPSIRRPQVLGPATGGLGGGPPGSRGPVALRSGLGFLFLGGENWTLNSLQRRHCSNYRDSEDQPVDKSRPSDGHETTTIDCIDTPVKSMLLLY